MDLPSTQAAKRQQVAKILQQSADQAQSQGGAPAVAISSSQLSVSPASGADLTVRNMSAAPVVFSVSGAPEQVCHEVSAPYSSKVEQQYRSNASP